MVLTEARKRALREYEGVLARIGLTEVQLREIAARHKQLSRATAVIPHHGVTGTAANFALHLASLRDRGAAQPPSARA
jgi:hypothetical protein